MTFTVLSADHGLLCAGPIAGHREFVGFNGVFDEAYIIGVCFLSFMSGIETIGRSGCAFILYLHSVVAS